MLAFIAADRGYKPGWVYHKYIEKFGEQPRGHPLPIQPTQDVLAWVRSRNIAYAKAKEKERAG